MYIQVWLNAFYALFVESSCHTVRAHLRAIVYMYSLSMMGYWFRLWCGYNITNRKLVAVCSPVLVSHSDTPHFANQCFEYWPFGKPFNIVERCCEGFIHCTWTQHSQWWSREFCKLLSDYWLTFVFSFLLFFHSDDMLIKLWDWEKKWLCSQVFEGHTHYVMQIVINPKDNNQFASASLDRTIKVWLWYMLYMYKLFPKQNITSSSDWETTWLYNVHVHHYTQKSPVELV